MIGLGIRKLSRNGPSGAKVHITPQDLELVGWKIGILVEVSYDEQQNRLIIKPVRKA